jgi:hypothetical protein
MKKISKVLEQIFAHAVMLEQNGGMKNSIFCIRDNVFILNYDHSLLLRFKLKNTKFEEPISFKANDYDSSELTISGDKVMFVSKNTNYERLKTVKTTAITPEKIEEIWESFDVAKCTQKLELDRTVLDLLEDSLSHIEISGDKGGDLNLLQRDIYAGSTIAVKKKNQGLFKSALNFDFGPVAVKTNDIAAIFSFQNSIKLNIGKAIPFLYIQNGGQSSSLLEMEAILALCVYDEVAELQSLREESASEPVKKISRTKVKRKKRKKQQF